MIRKVSGGYKVVSHQTGKSFGTYPTKAQAERRLFQLSHFQEGEVRGSPGRAGR